MPCEHLGGRGLLHGPSGLPLLLLRLVLWLLLLL